MQWLELTIKTTPQVIDLVAASLTMLGFDSFIIDDETDFQLYHNAGAQHLQRPVRIQVSPAGILEHHRGFFRVIEKSFPVFPVI